MKKALLGLVVLALVSVGVANAAPPDDYFPTVPGTFVQDAKPLPPPPATPPPATLAPPTVVLPDTVQTVPSFAYRPVYPLVKMPPTYYVGRGVLGQPTLYVPRQPVRNFFRFFSP